MISQTKFIIVDTETTGLVPALDRIIEIGAVKVVNGQVMEEFDTLINPEIFVPVDTTSITGITSDMLSSSPKFEEVAPKFLDFLGNDFVFVAHNVEFDKGFVNESLMRCNLAKMDVPFLCTVDLAKHVHPNIAKYGLGNLASLFGVEMKTAHRAIDDAKATAELFIKFMKVLQNGGLKYVHEIPHIKNVKAELKEQMSGQGSLF